MRALHALVTLSVTAALLAPATARSVAETPAQALATPASSTATAATPPRATAADRPVLHPSHRPTATSPGAITSDWIQHGKKIVLTKQGETTAGGTASRPLTRQTVRPMTGGASAPVPTQPVPVVRAPDWNVQVVTTNSVSAGASAAYFPGTTPTDVLFGGFGHLGRMVAPANTTSLWDGRRWQLMSPATSPAARGGAMMAYDPAIGKVVLYGGWNGISTFYSDTWTWDGTNWTQLSPASSPGGLAFASMAYDPAIGKLVLVGGASTVGSAPAFRLLGGSPTGTPTSSNQTWTFDGTSWVQLTPATSPSARLSSSMAYDSTAGNLILFGGYGAAGALGDTWRFNGTTWTNLAPVNAPPAASDASMAYDSTLSSIVLFGGMDASGNRLNTTRLWDAGHNSWQWGTDDVAASARNDAAIAPAATNGQLMLYGGMTTSTNYDNNTYLFDWGRRGASTGDQSYDLTLNDRLNLSVDVGSGNLYLKQAGLNLPGTGVSLETFAQYNSQAGGGVTDANWPMTLRYGPSGSMELDGLAGADDTTPFYANGSGGFASPAGVNATLQYVSAASGYELILNAPSQQIYWLSAPPDDGTGNPGMLTAITDHSGNTLSVSGNLSTGNVTILDTRGRTITRAVASGTATWTIPDGRTWTEGPVSGGWQVLTDPDGYQTQLGYGGPNGMLSNIVDPNGRQIQISYDAFQRVASITRLLTSSAGPTVAFHWDLAPVGGNAPTGGNPDLALWRTDPNGHTQISYNSYGGQTIGSTDPLGHDSTASYNANLSPVTQTDALGNTATATYASGDPTVQTGSTEPISSSGHTAASTTAVYNTPSSVLGYQHLPSSSVDTQGNCTAKRYDAAGQLTDVYSGQGSPCDGLTAGTHTSTRYQGDPGVTSCGGLAGEICSTTNGKGATTGYAYDSYGNLTTMTPPSPMHNTTYTYDASSRLATVTDGTGVHTMSYDGEDRTTQILYAGATSCTPSAGTCVAYSYDADGNRIQEKDKSGFSIWAYDALNRMVKETPSYSATNTCSSPNDAGIVYRYDDDSNLISMCSAGGTTNYSYDSNGKLLATGAPITQVGLSHASSGTSSSLTMNLPAETLPNDQIVLMVTVTGTPTVTVPSGYTLAATRTTPGIGVVVSVYTKTATSADTSVTVAAGQAAQVMVGVYRGVSTTTPVDAITSAAVSGTSITLPSITTTAASDKVLLTICGDLGLGPTGTEYSLTGLDSDQSYAPSVPTILASQTRTSSGAVGSRTVSGLQSQNLAGIMLALKPTDTTTVPTTYTYDADGNRLSTNYPDGVSQNMTYNGASQLTSINAVKNSTATTLFSYAASWAQGALDRSQRQSVAESVSGRTVSYTYDQFNRLTEAQDTAGGTNDYRYSYDLDGNLTKQTKNTVVTTTAYNSADEACWTVSGTSTNACASPPAGATTNTFDSSGNLTASSAGFAASVNSLNQNSSMTAPAGSAVAMNYAGEDQSVRTKAGSSNITNANDHVIASGPTGSVATFVSEPGGAQVSETIGGQTYYYLYDTSNNVVGLVDSSGTRQATYSYEPYGATTATGTAAAANPFRFAAGYQDATNLYHFGARYYDPASGRWTQQDPTGQDPSYTYAGDDPINSSDPSGTTNNANGRACSWWGCDFRLNNNRAHQLVDLLNVGAGAAAVCGVISAASGGGAPLALICGIVSGVLWAFSGYIAYLEDRWNRGIFFRVYWWGSWYVWHQ